LIYAIKFIINYKYNLYIEIKPHIEIVIKSFNLNLIYDINLCLNNKNYFILRFEYFILYQYELGFFLSFPLLTNDYFECFKKNKKKKKKKKKRVVLLIFFIYF